MSSRLTKKSLVSASGRSVKTPCSGPSDVGVEHAHAADEHRHLGRGQRQQLRVVDQQRFGRNAVLLLEVVAEAVGHRFEDGERLDIGLLLRGIRASRRERHRHGVAGVLRRLLDARATGQHDQVGERDLLAAGLRAVELAAGCLPAFRAPSPAAPASLTAQSFCGARRMRAPFAPPRLSEPRKVDADAHAVDTSCETRQPRRQDLGLQRGNVLLVDQRMIDGGNRDPARSALRPALPGRDSASADPCRGASA